MDLSVKLYLAMIVAGMRHWEAEYPCLNEDFTFRKSIQGVLVAIGIFVFMGFYDKSSANEL